MLNFNELLIKISAIFYSQHKAMKGHGLKLNNEKNIGLKKDDLYQFRRFKINIAFVGYAKRYNNGVLCRNKQPQN